MKTPGTSTILHLAGKMKRPTMPVTPRAKRRGRSLTSSIGFGAAFVLIISAVFYTASSASSTRRAARSRAPFSSSGSGSQSGKAAQNKSNRAGLPNDWLEHNSGLINQAGLFSLLMPQAAPVESIATYDSTCTNAKNVFNLGETVCVKVDGAPIRAEVPLRRINWSGPNGNARQTVDVTSASQTDTFSLPATGTSVIDGETIDNRGTWAVSLNSTSKGLTRDIAYFTVKDPANVAADLSIYNFSLNTAGPVAPGGAASFFIWASNRGPDSAQNVHITQATPSNMTFVSSNADSGVTCTTDMSGVTDCTISSLAGGGVATVTINYSVSAGAPNSFISSSASIASVLVPATESDPAVPATNDPHPDNNSSSAQVEIRTGGSTAAPCTLTCPANMTVTANTTQGGQPGAIVNFSGASVSGDCGAVSNSPASGSFLPVGTNTVTSTSDTGASCTFTVTVLDSSAPTISCPADITVTAAGSADEASVNPGTPTFTASGGGTIKGVRSDSKPEVLDDDGNVITPATTVPLTDPYPVGVTGILWTVTDADGRTATCRQKITVNPGACAGDNENPTITAPDDVTVGTGVGNTGCTVALDDELGQATVHDNCSASVTISGIPAGNAFAPGVYTLTYTATDGSGNTASDTQVVTVVDNTPPVIKAPADATYVCQSQVPAMNPADATRGDVRDEEGNLLPPGPPYENCGTATVTVSETRSGTGSASSPLIITRTFTATDAANNSASDTQTITVVDATPPTIQAPSDVSVNTGPGAASCDTVVSNATLGTATANDNCEVTVTRSPSGNTFPVGTTNVIWTATDAAGNTATATQHVTVTDNTAPIIAAPADKTLYTGAGATSCDVTVANLDATLGTATASDNCGSVTVVRGGGNVFPLGETLVTYTATDSRGNTATATQKVTVVDNTPPVVTPPANITVQLPLNSTATSMAVSYPNPATATDNCAGTITFSYSPASGSIFNVGPTTVTVTATDAHGNSATATFTVTVLYNFTGFFSPIGNLPILNVVNAGRAVPVKFSLSGNKGLNIFAADNPYSVAINCSTTAPSADVTETLTAGGSSLSYGPDQYDYIWKTESSWAGTCRQLVVTLNDGSVHSANFKFK